MAERKKGVKMSDNHNPALCTERFDNIKEFVEDGFGTLHEDIKEGKNDMKDHMRREESFYKWFAGILVVLFTSITGYIYSHIDDDMIFRTDVVAHIHELEIKLAKQPKHIADEVVRRLKEK